MVMLLAALGVNVKASPTASKSNAAEVDFGTLTNTGETVTAIAICASGTKETNDCWMWSNAADQAIGDGDDVTFPIGDINLSVA